MSSPSPAVRTARFNPRGKPIVIPLDPEKGTTEYDVNYAPLFSGVPRLRQAWKAGKDSYILVSTRDNTSTWRAAAKVNGSTVRIAPWKIVRGDSLGKMAVQFAVLAGATFAALGAVGAGPLAGAFGGAPAGAAQSTGAFDSFAYSSGESVVATTDAANVSYGFNSAPPSVLQPSTTVQMGGVSDLPAVSEQVTHAVGESAVSDFGVVSRPMAPPTDVIGASGDSIRAARAAGATSAAVGQVSGGGLATIGEAAKAAGSALTSAADLTVSAGKAVVAVAATGAAVRTATRSNSGRESTDRQNEARTRTVSTGQLGPIPGGMFGVAIALLGIGLVGYAAYKSGRG